MLECGGIVVVERSYRALVTQTSVLYLCSTYTNALLALLTQTSGVLQQLECSTYTNKTERAVGVF